MSLNEEYLLMTNIHQQEENALAEKYAKFKIGDKFLIDGKEFSVICIFPEEGFDNNVIIKYILFIKNSRSSEDKWISEEDLSKLERI